MKYKILYHMMKKVHASLSGGARVDHETIIEYVKDGQLDDLKTLGEDQDISLIRDENEMSLTMIASRENDLDVLKYLVDIKRLGCGDTIRDSWDSTCTMLAAQYGHMEVLKYLVEVQGAGCGNDIRDYEGMTCTMHAAEHGHLDVLKYLVEVQGAGCGNDITDYAGMSCTTIAAQHGQLEVLIYLVEVRRLSCDEQCLLFADKKLKSYIRNQMRISCSVCNS